MHTPRTSPPETEMTEIGPSRPELEPHRHEPTNHERHGGHGWMMIACCIPMLAIAVALVAFGVVNAGVLIVAVACTVMMAIMMRGMNHGGA